MSNATITRSFRLSEKLVEKLPMLARKYGQNENQFVSNLIAWRVAIDPLIPTFDSIALGKETFRSFLGIMDLDSLELLGWELGKNHFATSKALFEGAGESLTILKYFTEVLGEHAHWFGIQGSLPQNPKGLILNHHYNMKWSIFLGNYVSGAWEVVSHNRLSVITDDSFVKIEFPEEVRF